MKPTKKDIKKWCLVLRSGKYKQAFHNLNNSGGHCCMGVACDIFIPKNQLNKDKFGCISGSFPVSQNNAPIWLKNIDSDFSHKTGYKLSSLNDGRVSLFIIRHTFDEIADLLEAIYIHEVLNG